MCHQKYIYASGAPVSRHCTCLFAGYPRRYIVQYDGQNRERRVPIYAQAPQGVQLSTGRIDHDLPDLDHTNRWLGKYV